MPAPLSVAASRFFAEIRDHQGNFVIDVPYRNIQCEMMLGKAGSQLRCEIPFRGYDQITQSTLYPGVHEFWLFDSQYNTTNPLFSGPIWDGTASSGTGVISISAQDRTSVLAKRLLKVDKVYTAQQPADIIIDLINYTNGVSATGLTTNKVSSNTQTVSVSYKASDRNKILDLIDAVAQMGDGVEYYVRNNQLMIYGGKKTQATVPNLSLALEYGFAMNGYSVQINAQTLANDYDIVSSNGSIGNAVDASFQSNYGIVAQNVDRSDLVILAALNTAAATALKKYKASQIIPSLATKQFFPLIDFDFGDMFTAVVNDYWVQLNQVVRVVGWQLTLGQGDQYTVVLYTNDTSEVT